MASRLNALLYGRFKFEKFCSMTFGATLWQEDESYQTTRLKFSSKKLGNCCHPGAMNQAFGEVTVTKSVV